MNNNLPTFKVFCASEQAETDHVGTVDSNSGDLILTCACGRFLKLPAQSQGFTTEDYQSLIAEHKTANEGQVSLQGSFDALDALASAEGTVEAAPAESSAETTPVEEQTTQEEVAPADETTAAEPEVSETQTADATPVDTANVVTADPVN